MTERLPEHGIGMKKLNSAFCKALALGLVLSAVSQMSFADNWLLSVSGGAGKADSPPDSGNTADADLSADGVVHFVANYHESTDSDGARLYSEFFLGANTLEADVTTDSVNYTASIDALHAQVGGVYEWADSQWLKPYFVMTLGLSHYSPELTDEETYFSGTAGLGSRFRLTNKLSLKLEARVLGTLLNDSSPIFCQDDDECSVGIDGRLWNQQHFTAGMSWSF